MADLAAITSTTEPRPDVIGGQLADLLFAASLDKIVRDPESYPVYGDPEQFFALTHPTTGLKGLLQRTFGRLSGVGAPGAEHGVIRSQTSFGGGKTHGMIALYHLAKGARPSNVAEFLDPALLLEECQVAAVVGDALDPVAGIGTAGERTYTMWGDIAAQLGRFADMAANDEARTAPGSNTWATVIGNRPTVIIIDEIAAHLRQLASSGSEDVRRQAGAMPAFLKALFDHAAANQNVIVIVTLATRSDAYGKETSDIEEMLGEAEGAFQQAMYETRSVLGRSESIIRPAEDYEIAQILKTRLFKHIDPTAAEVAGAAYQVLYEEMAAKGLNLPAGADQALAYGELVRDSYPFHPELVRVLDQRLGTIPNFQRARGALKLLAEVISGLWKAGSSAELLNVADIDLALEPVLTHLTDGLGRDEYRQVAKADICGPTSHAGHLDQERFAGRAPFATRAATTVFIHSLEQIATAGAGRGDYLLGTLRVGDNPTVIDEALAHLSERAWYLDYDGARYRFRTEPNANAIVAEEARNIPNSQVTQELEERIAKAFPDDGPVKVRLAPTGPIDVPDEARLQLVVIHHNDESVTGRSATPPPKRIVDIRDRAGGAEKFRANRNGVVFLVADGDHVEEMRERVRFAMATERIAHSPDRLAQFSPEVAKKVTSLSDTAGMECKVAIARCYAHLYYPANDKANSNLRHYEMPAKDKGSVPDKLTKTVVHALRDEGKITESKMAVDYLRQKAWPPSDDEVLVSTLDSYIWRDHGAKLILDPNVRRETIRDGVANGTWVYYDPDSEKTWTAGGPPPPVVLDGSARLYTIEKATELGLLRKPLRVEDITAVVTGVMSAPNLRPLLEQRLGYEPQKKEVQQVLARAASGGPAAAIVVVVGEPEKGMKAATDAQIERAYDPLWVMTPAKADELGIDTGLTTSKTPRPVEATGTAGVAMAAVADQVADRPGTAGITMLHVTTTADPGEGIGEIRSLGYAIPMLPRFEITVTVEIALDFAGLSNGIHVDLQGSAAHYQALETQLLSLADRAAGVAGRMRLDLRPPGPMSPDGAEFEMVRKALVNVDPGEITVRGELA
jgi:hypothetical protein